MMNQQSPFSIFDQPAPQQPQAAPQSSPAPVASDELLDGLNDQQRKAVLHEGGPVLVVAGAGSGKTRVLTRRIAYLVGARGVHPGSILAITFTNKAAAEMRERVQDLVGNRAKSMWVSTFHSACVRILRSEIDALGFKKNFSIYDSTDSKRLMTMVLKDQGTDPKKFPVRQVQNWVSNCKNELIGPAAFAENDEGPSGNVEIMAEAYKEYARRLKAANALDFDDLIMLTVELFEKFPDIREKYRRRFRQVLVDEYQDTNHAQYMLIKQLCGQFPTPEGEPVIVPSELMVVGDSDQSIYAFRGATIRNILDFEKDFPGAETILLEQNYRSTQTVLSAANAVIKHNSGRPEKNLWSDSGDGEKIVGYVADTEHDEARYIAQVIDQLVENGHKYSDVAVFYRTNAQSRPIEEVFIRVGLPYRVVGGVRFYVRKEVRDAIAYLRAISNPADDVSLLRVINTPKRGIGDRAQQALQDYAAYNQSSVSEAIANLDEIPGIATRSRNQIKAFSELLAHWRQLDADGSVASDVLQAVLTESGLLDELKASKDPQDETRVENLVELVAVAQEFVAQAGAVDLEEVDEHLEAGGLAGGMAEPDQSLAVFLERVALVADSDQIPDAGDGLGVVTLMTLHTAKGLEFDTVFLTGLEDGVFPHSRSMGDRSELSEERRLAYVGITRARKRLYLTRASVRSVWGSPSYNPVSRFVEEIPDELIDWRRTGHDVSAWQNKPIRPSHDEGASVFGSGRGKPKVEDQLRVGDRVLHTSFGMGDVLAVNGSGSNATVDVDFGSLGKKRLALRYAPMEKL